MAHSVRTHLDVGVEEYDVAIRRLVPSYDEMLDEIVGALDRRLGNRPSPTVLDLGAGTGRAAARILRALPRANVVLFDVDPEILGVAQRRLSAESARTTTITGSFHDSLPTCDAVVASLSLHHVFELEQKREIHRRIHEALRPSGVLIVADAMLGEKGFLPDDARQRWAAHLVAHGDTEAQALGRFDDWAREDRYFPVSDELASLQAAGFAEIDVLFRRGPIAVIAALRGAGDPRSTG